MNKQAKILLHYAKEASPYYHIVDGDSNKRWICFSAGGKCWWHADVDMPSYHACGRIIRKIIERGIR